MSVLFDSVMRMTAIGRITFLEAMRKRTLLVMVVFGVVMLAGMNLFTDFAFFEQVKFLKDLGYAAVSWTGLLVALIGASQMIPAEIERRTIYTVMSKPVLPLEYIVGKYFGMVAVLTLVVLVMSGLFFGVLAWSEGYLVKMPVSPVEMLEKDDLIRAGEVVRAQIYDGNLLKALLLVWVKLCVVAAIALCLSTVATSNVFVISLTVAVYFIGHLQAIAREGVVSGEGGVVQAFFLAAVALLVPDFTMYSLIDEVISGDAPGWGVTLGVAGYSAVYCGVLVVVAALLFEGREL